MRGWTIWRRLRCAVLVPVLVLSPPALAAEQTATTADLIASLARESVPAQKELLAKRIAEVATAADVPLLEDLLRSKDPFTRIYAAVALHRIAPQRSIDALIAELKAKGCDPSHPSAWCTTLRQAIAQLKDERALSGLLDILAQGDRLRAEEAATLIRALGPAPVQERLAALAPGKKVWTVLYASSLLLDIDRPAGIAGLKRAWALRDRAQRQDALAYQLTRHQAIELAAVYREMLSHPEASVVNCGLFGLAMARVISTRADVLAALQHKETSVQATAMMALVRIGDAPTLERARRVVASQAHTPEQIVNIEREMEFGLLGEAVSPEDRLAWRSALRARGKMTPTAETIVHLKQACEYWGGEGAYSHERGQEIAQGLRRDCTQAVAQTTALLKQYPHDAAARSAARSLLELVKLYGFEKELEHALQQPTP